MHSAALSSQYGYGAPLPANSPYGDPSYGPMAKKRRLDHGVALSASHSPVSSSGGETGLPNWQGLPQGHPTPVQQHFSSTYSAHVPSSIQPQPAYRGQWNLSQSPYPDVSSYQQPYFYQQTDPSTYNSPWPPASHNVGAASYMPATSSIGYHGSNSLIPQQTPSLPFFTQPQSSVEQQPQQTLTETYQPTADTAFPNYPDLDPPQVSTMKYVIPQMQRQAQRSMSDFNFEDASMHLKLQSLPILDNLATQIIQTIAKSSFPEIQDLVRRTDAEVSQAYATLKSLFDQTRKVYSRETAFIDAVGIQMFQPSQQEVIRKANIATFVSSLLGAHDVSLFHLNDYFLDTFVPLGHRLLKWQGAIYLDLKTQTYISALMNSDTSAEVLLDELFPNDLDAQILTRHPDAPSLSPSEQDFVDRSRSRKSYLLAEPVTEDSLADLPKKYQWHDFVREFAACISKNVDGLLNIPLRTHNIFGAGHHSRRRADATHSVRDALAGQQGVMARKAPQSDVFSGLSGMPSLHQHQPSPAAAAAAAAATGVGTEKNPPPSGGTTVRQAWTDAEQEALLSGLEKVDGPHWSQILALYGRGGSISEVLKDRNQVQLKDKARNLKLWYLKTGKEVPAALRGVTGELRKRGGARARAALGLLDNEVDGSTVDAAVEGIKGEAGVDASLDTGDDGQGGGQKKTKKKAKR
ncbi:hypothetical protein KC363_g2620 [Hortaea werneckii]|uniref:Myb-like domain-containing protein n=1 Tax=Hortaea werneckii TaxID=91943 RepID=A0A3M7FD31_HORWE|nr:hypothetical protein KC363_g2620 [Hortaea werneckii]RMY86557.1 hypothetical protein D0861_05860 [Hortaea werneckii]